MPFLWAWMAKPVVVVEVVFVVVESSVDSGGADFFFPTLSNRAKFSRVNRARFSWCSLSSRSLSLPICLFRNRVVGETHPGVSTLSSTDEACGRVGDLGFGSRRVVCTISYISG